MAVCLAGQIGGSGLGVESLAAGPLLKNGVRAGAPTTRQALRPPSRGTRKRIFHPGERPGPARPRTGRQYGWFWSRHPPGARAAWTDLVATVDTHRRGGARLTSEAALRQVISRYRPMLDRAGRRHRVSAALLAAVIVVESAGQPGAVSPKGAQGLMQLIPATARRFGVDRPLDPAQNIDGGAAYLSWLIDRFDGDLLRVLAGYNAGEGAVDRHKGVPPYRETRNYVVRVIDALVQARTLCTPMPDGPRASCNLPPQR